MLSPATFTMYYLGRRLATGHVSDSHALKDAIDVLVESHSITHHATCIVWELGDGRSNVTWEYLGDGEKRDRP
jgi:hypothetical protein